jgi:3,4-dihydroxy 2-butanone 4-phosphate synthase/GTP cyclohydrolase II
VGSATAAVAAGRPVVVVDDLHTGEGELVCAAENVTPVLMAFLVRHTSGLIRVSLPGTECARLDLPLMSRSDPRRPDIDYTVTADAKTGTTTGISAIDRTRTARLLAAADSAPGDFTRPGHLLAARARDRGVLDRPGPAEAAVDLVRLAGLRPAAASAAVVSVRDPLRMAGPAELERFAAEHDLPVLTTTALLEHQRRTASRLVRGAEARIPTAHGEFRAIAYRNALDSGEHLALVAGDPGAGGEALVYLHRECGVGDVFGSLACACHRELDNALAAVGRRGAGIVVYLRTPTQPRLTCPATDPAGSDGADAAQILSDLGVHNVRLAGARQVDRTILTRHATVRHGAVYTVSTKGDGDAGD